MTAQTAPDTWVLIKDFRGAPNAELFCWFYDASGKMKTAADEVTLDASGVIWAKRECGLKLYTHITIAMPPEPPNV